MCVGQTIASKTGAKNVKKVNLITILDKTLNCLKMQLYKFSHNSEHDLWGQAL
jgi:hypothetical protein